MQATQYGRIALVFLTLSICSLVYKNIAIEYHAIWNIIPQLLILLFLTWSMPYLRPMLTKKRFLICSIALAFGCSLYQLDAFWSNSTLLMTSLGGMLLIIGVSNFIYFNFSRSR
ncbi:MAG: hypothetical protein ACJA11_001584 [Glaciecola sp.]|jgi:hypothetical protein